MARKTVLGPLTPLIWAKCMIVIYYTLKPSEPRFKTLTPKKLRIKTARTMRTSPERAEVRSSWEALTRLGSPAEVANWKPATIMRIKAIPPAIPTAQVTRELITAAIVFKGIQPIAVLRRLVSPWQ